MLIIVYKNDIKVNYFKISYNITKIYNYINNDIYTYNKNYIIYYY